MDRCTTDSNLDVVDCCGEKTLGMSTVSGFPVDLCFSPHLCSQVENENVDTRRHISFFHRHERVNI